MAYDMQWNAQSKYLFCQIFLTMLEYRILKKT